MFDARVLVRQHPEDAVRLAAVHLIILL
jgi:hypothetical protein